MRYAALALLLALGCGSVDAERPTCQPGTSCSSCPDIEDPHFGGYFCSIPGPGDDHVMMCGIIDSSKPPTTDPRTGESVYSFARQNAGCYAFAADGATLVHCVAACP